MIIYLLIVIGVVLGINYIIADFMKDAAYAKGYTDRAHPFAMVFWLGIFGCLYVIALPDLKLHEQNEKIIKLLEERGQDLPVSSNKAQQKSAANSQSFDALPRL